MTRKPHSIPLARIMAVWNDPALPGYRKKALALGVSIGTMHRWAEELDLAGRKDRSAPRKALDEAAIRAVWADEGLPTMRAKADALGCGVTTLQRRRRDIGFPVLPSGPKQVFDRDALRLLWRRGISAREIARLLKVSRDVVCYTAWRMGLPDRGRGFVPEETLHGLHQRALRHHLASASAIEQSALICAEMVDRVSHRKVA